MSDFNICIGSDSEDGNLNKILEKVAALRPSFLPLFYACISGWMRIQKNRLQVLTLQRRLNHYLMLYMRRRQKRLKIIEIYNSDKMMLLLDHIRSPMQFQKLFRVKLDTFLKIQEILYSKEPCTSGWLPEIELLLFLFWLSGGLSYKKVVKHLGISESILRDMFQRVSERFLKHVSEVIHFPKDSYRDIGEGFKSMSGTHIFGLVMGCLDAFHVSIAFPSQKLDFQYLNDQDEFSVQVQVVCDHRGVLTDIAIGYPGSLLKHNILRRTPIYLEKRLPPAGRVLLCGQGYPCLLGPICIIPPYTNIADDCTKAFNKVHEETHSILKKSIGQMFDRWRRIFSKPIMYPLSDITDIVATCAMIHNIGLKVGDVWPKKSPFDLSVNDEFIFFVEGEISGENTRKSMVRHTSSANEINLADEEYSISSDLPEDE